MPLWTGIAVPTQTFVPYSFPPETVRRLQPTPHGLIDKCVGQLDPRRT